MIIESKCKNKFAIFQTLELKSSMHDGTQILINGIVFGTYKNEKAKQIKDEIFSKIHCNEVYVMPMD